MTAYRSPDASDVPSFEALSYVWGSPNDPVDITVVPSHEPRLKQTDYLVSVGQTLHEALLHLRQTDVPRVLWIDALCINQEDLTERSHQVKRMRHIYSYAYRVVAWLGPSTDDSQRTLGKLEYLWKQLEHSKPGYMTSAPGCQEKRWWSGQTILPFGPDVWDSIVALVHRPWFERVWIVQEIQLSSSRTVGQCGNDVILWYHLRRAILKVTSVAAPQLNKPELYYKKHHLNFLIFTMNTLRYDVLLRSTKECKCEDARDRVYSMLGLLPRALVDLIRPDYAATALRVFRDAFVATVEASHQFNLMGTLSDGPTPSQMPDIMPEELGTDRKGSNSGMMASSASAVYIVQVSDNQLDVIGVIHSVVDSVADDSSKDLSNNLEAARGLVSVRIKQVANPIMEDELDVFTQVVITGWLRDQSQIYKALPSMLEAADVLNQVQVGGVSYVNCHQRWMEDISRVLSRGKIFSTNTGHIGHRDMKVKKGDRIGVVLGLSDPVLLRPSASGTYQVIGRCHVHGLMDREAISGLLPKS